MNDINRSPVSIEADAIVAELGRKLDANDSDGLASAPVGVLWLSGRLPHP